MNSLFPVSANTSLLRVTTDMNKNRYQRYDWLAVETSLGQDGYAVLPSLLTPAECQQMAGLFFSDERFRSHIVMERYAFGKGDYKYFSNPLPDLVGELRQSLYPVLAPVANRWHAAMRMTARFPVSYRDFQQRCHDAGQRRPTPLLLRYEADDYCCLHQDLYGEHVFPFQVIVLLSQPGQDFDGGELLLTESNPKKTRPGRGCPSTTGGCRRAGRKSSPGSFIQGVLSGESAAWCLPDLSGGAIFHGHYFPRCELD